MNYRYLARAKVGDTIKIIGFTGDRYEAERNLIGKTGKVEFIDDAGTLHGTWGSLGLLIEDQYEVISKGE